jgi:hypothetical protein
MVVNKVATSVTYVEDDLANWEIFFQWSVIFPLVLVPKLKVPLASIDVPILFGRPSRPLSLRPL